MNIVNISFNSINAVRNNIPKAGLKTTNNKINIDSLEETNIGMDKLKIALKLGFTHKTEYASDFASIELKGNILLLADSKEGKDLLEKHNKGKLPIKDLPSKIINAIMIKSSIESILIAKELGLPSPVPLPTMKVEELKQGKK